jgi:hypothetical protein
MSRAEAEILRVADAHRHLLTEEIEKAKATLGFVTEPPEK